MNNHTLEKIYGEYFEILNDYFGILYRPQYHDSLKAAKHYANLPLAANIIYESINDLTEDITDFWKKNFPKFQRENKKIDGLKTCYGGDISPVDSLRLVSRTALYVDTIFLPDPMFTLCLNLKKVAKDKTWLFYMIKHTFNILNIKDFFFSDLDRPILVLYPRTILANYETLNILNQQGEKDTIEYFSNLTGKNFASGEQLQKYLEKQTKYELFLKSIKRRDMLIPEFNQEDSVNALVEYHKFAKENFPLLKDKTIGQTVGNDILGRMMMISEHACYCDIFSSEPVYDAPNSWHIFKWKLKNNNLKVVNKFNKNQSIDIDTLIINSLQLEKFRWLGNVPNDKLLLMRKNEELSELREILRGGLFELKYCQDDELNEVANDVSNNLNKKLREHEGQINKFEKEYKKKYKIDFRISVMGAVFSVVSSLTSPITSIISASFAAKGCWDSCKDIKSHENQLSSLNARPMGILFNAYQDSKLEVKE